MSFPTLSVPIQTATRSPPKERSSVGRSPGYSLKEIENYGEVAGPSSFYHTLIPTAVGPFVTDGLQNHNSRLIKEKRLDENTDFMERTQIGKEKLAKDLREYDEPEERRVYELPRSKWPRPDKPVRVIKKCHDETFRPPTPLEEMTPFPDVEKFKTKAINYIGDPYENTAQTSYLTGAKSYNGLNNAKYDKPPGYYAPEPYEQRIVKRPRDKRDVFYADTRKYLPGFDSMNTLASATPYSRRSNLPDTRRSIPSTVRRTFE